MNKENNDAIHAIEIAPLIARNAIFFFNFFLVSFTMAFLRKNLWALLKVRGSKPIMFLFFFKKKRKGIEWQQSRY